MNGLRLIGLACALLAFCAFCCEAGPLVISQDTVPSESAVRLFLQKNCPHRRPVIVHMLSPFKSTNQQIEREHDLLRYALLAASQQTMKCVDVQYVAAVLPSDLPALDEHPLGPQLSAKTQLCILKRSFSDMLNVSAPSTTLPFFSDVLDCTQQLQYDALVYSNFDIIPMPLFYGMVAYLRAEHPTAVYSITRKALAPTVPLDDLEAVYARFTLTRGHLHPGHDCYIFPRSEVDFRTGRPLGTVVGGSYGAALINSMWERSIGFFKLDSKGEIGTFHVDDQRGGRDLWLASAWNTAIRFACTKLPADAVAINYFLNPAGRAMLDMVIQKTDCRPETDARPPAHLLVYSFKEFQPERWIGAHEKVIQTIKERIEALQPKVSVLANQSGGAEDI